MSAIISNFPRFNKLYIKLFIRQDNNKDVLWHGIIDISKDYEFQLFFDTIPKQRKILLSIRDELKKTRAKDHNQKESLRYIASQRLFSSSLSEDITNFDFTSSVIRIEKPDDDESNESEKFNCQRELYLEGTEVNNHECMATVCGFIRHLFESGITDLPDEDEDVELPDWMQGIRSTLMDSKTHKNIKIFLVKLIDNLFDVFTHYSKWFIEPLLQFVVDKCAGSTLNYFITDVLIILSKWAPMKDDLSDEESELASQLLQYLIQNLNRERQDFFKYNLDIIKMIVEAWKSVIKIPTELLSKLIASDSKWEIGVHVASIFLVNRLEVWSNNESHDFLNSLLKRLNTPNKPSAKLCAETVGLFLRYFDDAEYTGTVDKYVKKVQDFDKYILYLEGIAIHYPLIINAYHISKLLCALNQCNETQRLLRLKIIGKRLEDSSDIAQDMSDFQIVEWHRLLEDPNLDIQINTVNIVKNTINTFTKLKVFPEVMTSLSRNVNHSNDVFRSCIYDTALLLYEQNGAHSKEAKNILLMGLTDPSQENNNKVVDIWKEKMDLSNLITDRFSYVLSEMYVSKTEDHFLGLANYFFLNLLSNDEKFDDPLFEHPLEDCDFEDYELKINWRLQHPSVVPLFAETLQTFDTDTTHSYNNVFQLRQTQASLNFTPTQNSQDLVLKRHTSLNSSLGLSVDDATFKNPNSLSLSQKYRHGRRFLKDKNKISREFAHREVTKKVVTAHKRVDLAKEREKKVTIYRSYRKGDFPDIQIAFSAVLTPLQILALQDNEVSKILFQEIFKGVSSKLENNAEFLEKVSNSITDIFKRSTTMNPFLIGAVLDILLKNTNKIRIDPQLIAYVCQESGLISIGTLLLEEYIISLDYQPSGSKRGTGSEQDKEVAYWVKLAELYKQLEEWEIVQAIFLEKMDCKESIKEAIYYESESLWKNAQDCYSDLLRTDLSPERKDFYYESYFKCFASLGEWDKIPDAITAVMNNDISIWDQLWDGEWNQQKLLPWYITAQLKNGLFNQNCAGELLDTEKKQKDYLKYKNSFETFFKDINDTLSDDNRGEYLRSNFSEELCMMALCQKDIPFAKIHLERYIRYFLEAWQRINPMYQPLRYQKLLTLHGFIESGESMSIYDRLADEFETSIPKVIEKWEALSKEVLLSVMMNETRHLYRTQFVNILVDKFPSLQDIDHKQYVMNLKRSKIKMDIDFINIAAESKNFYLAKKYYEPYKEKRHVKLDIAFGNIALAKSKILLDPMMKLRTDLEAQSIFQSTLTKSKDQKILFDANRKLFDIRLGISDILNNQEIYTQHRDAIDNLNVDMECREKFSLNAYNEFKKSILNLNEDMECDNDGNMKNNKDIARAYVTLAHFIRNANMEDLQGEFILFVLRAMKFDSLEGRQLFPCVLMQTKLGNEHKKMFIEEVERIPTWMFLSWVPQLLAYLNSDKIFAISGVVQRISETYPHAINFPYRLSRESYSNIEDTTVAERMKILIEKLDALLLSDELIDKFLKALSYVCVPAAILRYYVEKIIKCQQMDDIKRIHNKVMSDVLNGRYDSKDANCMQGNTYKKVDNYKKDFIKLNDMNMTKMKDNFKKLNETLKTELNSKDTNSKLLKDYCPWLANFSGNRLNAEIEIPGQYDGSKLPLPQHHVKISGFQTDVIVLKSIRKPIKVIILGMDTKEYPFLVKFGEDLRQDQRIEQLFSLMNDIYKHDTPCANNGLHILTYQVVPLTTSLGMIQWIDPTQTLNGFMEKSLKDKKINEKVWESFYKWMPNTNDNRVQAHGLCATKYNKDKVIAFYRSLVNRIPLDTLRKSFESISTNTENFIALRNNFIKTYSVLCISQWILGIGDRHLENSLICTKNGQVLGIDFGHAFGTATQILPIPELVPIRLTPHLINLMEPLGERGQFRAYMIHCLKAMRNNSNSLLSTMNVFIEEPSLDWLEHASRFENVIEDNLKIWYPKTKVEQAKRKLAGTSSSKILIEDLKAGSSKFTQAFVKLVEGESQHNVRARFENDEKLTVEEQVECLLDHATDYNLLGRMFGGWKSWV